MTYWNAVTRAPVVIATLAAASGCGHVAYYEQAHATAVQRISLMCFDVKDGKYVQKDFSNLDEVDRYAELVACMRMVELYDAQYPPYEDVVDRLDAMIDESVKKVPRSITIEVGNNEAGTND